MIFRQEVNSPLVKLASLNSTRRKKVGTLARVIPIYQVNIYLVNRKKVGTLGAGDRRAMAQDCAR